MPETRYQRLTFARTRRMFSVLFRSRVSLWLGPDHILFVDSSGFSETYKRFYFRDIQAFTVRETKRRAMWNAVLVGPTVICIAGWLSELIFSPRNDVAMIIWLIASAVFLVPFLLNNIFGPACACYLRTAVQIEELPSLCRIRKARKVLAKIRPLILAAQGGELSAAAVSTRMRDRAISAAGGTPTGTVADQSNAPSGGGS